MLIERELACPGNELGLVIGVGVVGVSILKLFLLQRPAAPR